MSCAGFDLRDYFFGELPEAERASAERHIADCTDCTAELEQLQLVRGSLLTLRDEEMPRRIGFISDKIFEPSPVRRWLSGFWLSGARLGFASAAMLSAALLVVSVRQQPKVVERRVEVASAPAADVKAVVAEAVSAALAQQDKKNRELLEATERRHYYEEHGMALRLADYAENLEKRYQASRSMAMDYGSEVHPLGAKP
jgi:anti-sigma factor RsiW